MRIDIISCLPSIFDGPLNQSIVKRAIQKKIIEIHIHDLRDYSTNKHKSVDDYAYGGGAGMVIMIEPIANCLNKLKEKNDYDEIIFLAPDGEKMTQLLCNEISLKKNIILLCGHYKGIDERVRQHLITREISIGDYVLSGGELAAMVLSDAVIRLIPGVLNDESSALSDSFQDNLIAPPVFTRPAIFNGWEVPKILQSGNEAKIKKWNFNESLKRTQLRRPNLITKEDKTDI